MSQLGTGHRLPGTPFGARSTVPPVPITAMYLCPAALLVLLARSAGAGIVASDLVTGDAPLDGREIAGAGHARLVQFPFLLARELGFDLVDGGLGAAVYCAGSAIAIVGRGRRRS